ncbi:MAG TPA: pili assembly chaperone [Terriglobales bacterium]|nr:pili assembly chaperone [Terriglobales bacterium]
MLIVVAIILIIAAIAIPNLLRARISANESSAVGSIRTINTSQVTYSTNYPNVGFANTLAALGGATPCTATAATACLIDQVLAGKPNQKSGYAFALAGFSGSVPEVTYTISGDPIARGQTGQRSFFSDGSGVIRFNTAAVATIADPPLQ